MKAIKIIALSSIVGLGFVLLLLVAALVLPPLVVAPIVAIVFLLLIRFMDLYEREPLYAVSLMFLWGAVFATTLSLFGNVILGAVIRELSPAVEAVYGAAIYAPLIEETAKGLALVAAFFIAHRMARRFGTLEFEGVTDGIVYGAAVGLGFTVVEDIFYFLNFTYTGDLGTGFAVYQLRTGFLGVEQLVGHAVYTGTFGAALGLATWSRSKVWRIGFPVLGLAAAMFMHAVNNGLGSLILVSRYGFDNVAAWMGGPGVPVALAEQMSATMESTVSLTRIVGLFWVALFFIAIALWLRYQRRVIRHELAEEANNGLIGREEAEIMPLYFRRSGRYWRLLRQGRIEEWKLVRRVHNELADLAFLKWRLRKLGGDWNQVEIRRRRIAILRSQEIVESPITQQLA